MYISSFRLENYKSFLETPTLSLGTGFNVIVGQNNVGKSALIEALAFRATWKPHRSLRTVPAPHTRVDKASYLDISFVIDRDELAETLLLPDVRRNVPLPQLGTPFSESVGLRTNDSNLLGQFWSWLITQTQIPVSGRFEAPPSEGAGARWVPSSAFPSVGQYLPQPADKSGHRMFGAFVVQRDSDRPRNMDIISSTQEADFGLALVLPTLQKRVYAFRAERFTAGVGDFGPNVVLGPRAENLAQVLNMLQSNPSRFADFNNLVSTVFPQVKWVSVHPSGTQLQIRVWMHDPTTKRDDLAVPLDESGTGIGQVLAILYVVLTAPSPRTIIIDEPQSFLHPGALKKLIEILHNFSQHQYILATHSPAVITACQPETVLFLRLEDQATRVERIEPTRIGDARVYLAEIGATLSDVFGADNVVWVEGATEEICFPQILARLKPQPLRGTVIRGVRNTGDFEGKHAEAVIDIYNRLSSASSLVPPALAFIFDSEQRTDEDMKELRHRGNHRVWFLPRRMYENYLLNPKALADVINASDPLREQPVTSEQVSQWLTTHGPMPRYGKPRRSDEQWESYADSADLLKRLFSELTGKRVSYEKTRHSTAVTEWILSRNPDELLEVAEVVSKAIEARDNTCVTRVGL